MKSEAINEYDHMLFRTHGLYSDTKKKYLQTKADLFNGGPSRVLFGTLTLPDCSLPSWGLTYRQLVFVGLLYHPVSDQFFFFKFRVFRIVSESVPNRI